MPTVGQILLALLAAGLLVLAAACRRWYRHEHRRIRQYRKRLAYRAARVPQDIAWRHRSLEYVTAVSCTSRTQMPPLDMSAAADAMFTAPVGRTDRLHAVREQTLADRRLK